MRSKNYREIEDSIYKDFTRTKTLNVDGATVRVQACPNLGVKIARELEDVEKLKRPGVNVKMVRCRPF